MMMKGERPFDYWGGYLFLALFFWLLDDAETDFNGRLFFKIRPTHTSTHTQDKTLDDNDNDNDDNDDGDRQKKKKEKDAKNNQRSIFFFLLSDIAHTQREMNMQM